MQLFVKSVETGNIIVLDDYEPMLATITGSAIYVLHTASYCLPTKVRVFLNYLVACVNNNPRIITAQTQ